MTRLSTWEHRTEWPLTGAAIAFLAAYAIPIIHPALPAWAQKTCTWVSWGTWVLFAVDYVIRLALTDRRLRYAARHWLDLLIIVLPLLRPLRLLRLATLLTFLNRKASTNLRGKVAIYVAGGSTLIAFCAALAVLDAERASPDANITTFGDAMWWAITTMTTVGYGDRYPTTLTGRLAAVALMVGGITILGVVTATLASWLVERVSGADETTSDLRDEVRELRTEVARLADKLDQTGPPG